MDVRTLACFIAVAEELHFRRAAGRLNLTQPALSQRIRTLETEIGTPLFERDRRHVALTPAGNALIEHARVVVSHAEQGKTKALLAARGEIGRLRLGFTVIAFYGVLPEAVREFRVRCPEVAVELSEMNSPDQETALAAGRLDLGVLHPPLAAPGLGWRLLPEEDLLLALPSTHPLAASERIPVAALDGEPFLIAPRRIGPNIYDRVIALFRSAGFSPNIVQEVTPMTTLTGLVAAGVGIGLATASLARAPRPGVAYRPLDPPAPRLPIAVAWPGTKPIATAERFLGIVSHLLGSHTAEP